MRLPSYPSCAETSGRFSQASARCGAVSSLIRSLTLAGSTVASSACALALALLVVGATREASAALIATGDGTGNTTAPVNDFGFDHVGVVNGLTGVYVRNGWVLTANHVGEGKIVLDGVAYPPVPGSSVRLLNSDGTAADLILFKLATRPPLADLAITNTPPSNQTLIYVAGNGADRGAATTWMGIAGWQWTGAHTLRWGTNRISSVGDYTFDTHAFRITFDDLPNPGNQSEADIVTGDSGGGAFTGTGASAELVGILFARASYAGQPGSTSLYGNIGLVADLDAYRDAILPVTDRPDCSDGLDDDGDGTIDFPEDAGCAGPTDASERGSTYQCDNGLDDNANGLIDYPADPVCIAPTTPLEVPEPGATPAFGAGLVALAALARRRSAAAQTSSTRSTR
jgi:hypothetical protein